MLHDFTMTRWQGALLKICMVSLGILLAIYFPKTMKKLKLLRRVLFVVLAIYMFYLYRL